MAAYIASHNLVPPDSRILVAVSGGPDSCALFSTLVALQKKLKIAHLGAIYVDHGFRHEAKQEAEFVRNLAEKNGAEFFCGFLNLTHGAADEERGRKGRYALFADIAKKHKFDLVALAHHADDLAETMLINLSRGSGLMGLKGIAPKRDIYIRPLLRQRRMDILNYCEKMGINPCLDASNLGTDYLRNRIRLQLLPLWNQLADREITPILCRNADIMAADEEFLDKIAGKELSNILIKTSPYIISLAKFNLLDLSIKRRVARLAISSNLPYYYQPSFEQVGQFLAVAAAGRGQLWLPNNLQLGVEEGNLIIRERTNIVVTDTADKVGFIINDCGQFIIDGTCLFLEKETIENGFQADQTKMAYFDLEQIKWPLKVRKVESLDTMSLLGHQKRVKLSKVMSDLKIPTAVRMQQMVLCDAADEILWLLGYRRSAAAKISKEGLTDCLLVKIDKEKN